MTPILHPGHTHYLVHKEFIEGSFSNPDNPPIVQTFDDNRWADISNPLWIADYKYRIKPSTSINTSIVTDQQVRTAIRAYTNANYYAPMSFSAEQMSFMRSALEGYEASKVTKK